MIWTLTDEQGRKQQLLLTHGGEMARLRWAMPSAPDDALNPEMVVEHFEGRINMRIYNPSHEEPIVSVHFDERGEVTEMIICRSPGLPTVFEAVDHCPPEA